VVDELAEVREAGRDRPLVYARMRLHHRDERLDLGLPGLARLQAGDERAEAPRRRVRPGAVAG
jgi:hypothetical protein